MPERMPRPCSTPGCRELTTQGKCGQHKKEESKRYDSQRGTAHQRGYGGRWVKYRRWFLARRPICECKECKESGRILPATVVDHIKPHKGNYELFWDPNNHQAMAKRCHDKKTATEDGGFGHGSN